MTIIHEGKHSFVINDSEHVIKRLRAILVNPDKNSPVAAIECFASHHTGTPIRERTMNPSRS